MKQLENKWASYLNEQSEVLEPMSFLDSAMKDRQTRRPYPHAVPAVGS